MDKFKFILFLTFLFTVSVNVSANTINPVLKKNIEFHFMEGGQWSFSKIQNYKKKVETRKNELNFTLNSKGAKDKQEKGNILYNILISEIDRLATSNNDGLQTVRIILELDYALQYQSQLDPIETGISKVSQIFSTFKIQLYTSAQMEAVNLYDNESKKYLGPSDIQNFKINDVDISYKHPIEDSGFFKNMNFSGYDNLKTKVSEGLFESVQMGASGIELKVKKILRGSTNKFKLVIGKQINAQLTAQKLLNKIGYNTEYSHYVTSFKVILPKGMDIMNFKKFWKDQNSLEKIDPYIKSSGSLSSGQKFIVLTEAQLFPITDSFQKVGAWSWGRLGMDLKREVRGLLFYNIWIGNQFIKDSSTIIEMADSDLSQLKYYQHEFGNAFSNKPNSKNSHFDWELVSKVNDKYIGLNYRNHSGQMSIKKITYSDAKWMTRKICELTREDISQAVSSSGWSIENQFILTEKLLHRRNQLVEAFELANECMYIKVNLPDSMNPKDKLENHTELEKNIVDEVEETLKPYVDNIEVAALDIALKATEQFDTIVIDGQTIGIDSYILGAVEVSTERKVTPNSNPTGVNDEFLVMDKVKVSYSLGGGIVLRGKMNYIKEYKLVYPVSKFNELEDKNVFLVNAIRQKSRRTAELPENYVLIMEDSFEGEGEVLIGNETAFLSYGESYILGSLNRYVISQSKDKIVIQHDTSPYKAHVSALYAELLFFRFPIWNSPNTDGVLNSKKYFLNLENSQSSEALDQFYATGDLSKILELSNKTEINGSYKIQKGEFGLLGLIESSYEVRTDDFEEVIYTDDEKVIVNSYMQVDTNEKLEWGIFGYGELKQEKFKLLGKVDEEGMVKNSYLEVAFSIVDKSTTLDELERRYLKFVDTLANKDNFLFFTPSLHTQENYWGEVMIYARLGYNQEAMDKIIGTTSDEFYHLMAKYDAHKYHDYIFWKRRSPKNLKPGMRKYKQNLREFISTMNECKKLKKGNKLRYKLFAKAFEVMVWPDRNSFNISFLRRLNFLIGDENYFMDADLRSKSNHYILFSQGGGIYNTINPLLQKNVDLFEFRFQDPISIWSAFQLKEGPLAN